MRIMLGSYSIPIIPLLQGGGSSKSLVFKSYVASLKQDEAFGKCCGFLRPSQW